MKGNNNNPWIIPVPTQPTTRRQNRRSLPGMMPIPIRMAMSCRSYKPALHNQDLKKDDEDRKILITCFPNNCHGPK